MKLHNPATRTDQIFRVMHSFESLSQALNLICLIAHTLYMQICPEVSAFRLTPRIGPSSERSVW